MHVKLGRVLARVTVRSLEPEDEGFVDVLAVDGPQAAQAGPLHGRKTSSQSLHRHTGRRPGDSYNRNRRAARGRRGREDRIRHLRVVALSMKRRN